MDDKKKMLIFGVLGVVLIGILVSGCIDAPSYRIKAKDIHGKEFEYRHVKQYDIQKVNDTFTMTFVVRKYDTVNSTTTSEFVELKDLVWLKVSEADWGKVVELP